MKWEPKVKELYDNVVLRIPEIVRPVIKPQLFQNAEKQYEDRRGNRKISLRSFNGGER